MEEISSMVSKIMGMTIDRPLRPEKVIYNLRILFSVIGKMWESKEVSLKTHAEMVGEPKESLL